MRVFGLFMIADLGAMTLAQLVRLGTAAGLTATNIKSHVSRMVGDGSLVRTGPAGASQYAPSEHRLRIVGVLRDRLAPLPDEPWHRTWWVMGVDLPRTREDRERLRRALHFDGFRPTVGNAWIRPAWPEAVAQAAIMRHVECHGVVACKGPLIGALDIARTFRLDRAERAAARLSARIGRARRLLAAGGPRLVQTWLGLGGDAALFASEHPRLPIELLRDWPTMRTVLAAWNDFERDARTASHDFMHSMLTDRPRRRA